MSDTLKALIEIFLIDKRNALKKHVRNTIIRQDEFVDLIMACEAGILPWTHHISYRDIVPGHLQLNETDSDALTFPKHKVLTPERSKVMRKVRQIFRDRRYIVGHIFYSTDHRNWHFFYFDQRDIEGNHWTHGSHVHLINHLWPQYTADSLWQTFNEGNPDLNGALHVRYSRPEPEPPLWSTNRQEDC